MRSINEVISFYPFQITLLKTELDFLNSKMLHYLLTVFHCQVSGKISLIISTFMCIPDLGTIHQRSVRIFNLAVTQADLMSCCWMYSTCYVLHLSFGYQHLHNFSVIFDFLTIFSDECLSFCPYIMPHFFFLSSKPLTMP